MRVGNEIIFTAVDASTNQTSAVFTLNQVYGWAAQFSITGSPVGTLKAQVSCDPGSNAPYDAASASVTNWSDLQDSSITVNGAGTPGINFTGSQYNWLRFVFTSASGTGAISGRLNIKGV